MMRFVVNNYSFGDPLAPMVGILMDEDAPTVIVLRRALHLPAVRGLLAMLKTEQDEYPRASMDHDQPFATFIIQPHPTLVD